MPNHPSDADIIFNRASVALAKSQRLIASWLPPPTPSELANAKSEEEIEREEQDIFTPIPELLGLGASIPKEDEVKRQKLDTDEKLRRQLLGKDYKRIQNNGVRNGVKVGLGVGQAAPKPRPASMQQQVGDSEDEEGRSSLGKSKRRKLDKDLQNSAVEATDGKVEAIQAETMSAFSTSRTSKKPNNYLDEVLAKKSQKKRKMSQKVSNMKVMRSMDHSGISE